MEITKEYIDFTVAKIVELCGVPSPSGFTKKIEGSLIAEFEKLGFVVKHSNKGCVLVELGGEGNPLLLAAHMDTLGAMVRAVKENGRLRLAKIGSYPENNIERENCTIHTRSGKDYSGTVQLVNSSIHVHEDVGEVKRSDSTVEIVIDEKVKSKEDVNKLGIRPGDFITFDPRTVTSNGFIKSRHLDDKASVGILIGLAKFISEQTIELSRKVYLLFTTYEEVGHGAAAGIPDDVVEMVSVDMGAVGDDLETDEFKVSICAKDTEGPYDYDVTTRMINIAGELKLNYAVDIYPRYASDVGAAIRSGCDVKHGLVGPGIASSHGYERCHVEGIENTFKLLAAYISGKNISIS